MCAPHTNPVDQLEQKCLGLSADLQEKESHLAEVQEMERKCSREYIAYEKHKSRLTAQKVKARQGAAVSKSGRR